MIKKYCLFCDEITPTKPEGDHDRYIGCSCAPDGSYRLLRDSYESINSLPFQKKRNMLHLVSAYIRELNDCGEEVTLSADDIDHIVTSPKIPVTIEDKSNRLLQYLYRHSEGLGEAVVIEPLSSNYNLTYSPNLQELVYIIEKLRSEQLIIREGMSFQLTEKGRSEAAASAGGQELEPCSVLIAGEEDLRTVWQERLLPNIEQFGYLPRLLTHTAHTKPQNLETYSLELIADSKLIIADLTGQSPEVYFTAGYALGLNIPVVWTVNSSDAEIIPEKIKELRPIVWDTFEELLELLQQKLS